VIDLGKKNLLGVLVDAVDYEGAIQRIAVAARQGAPFAVSALAVHGVMTGYRDREQRARLNRLDLVVPDGQPVRWALNLLHGTRLPERVYGPELMWRLCGLAEREGLGLYLYGSTPERLALLTKALGSAFPRLRLCGTEPSRFRRLTNVERTGVIARIRLSGAQLVFVGLGCPRQEVWAYEYRDALARPIVAVGAAFDLHAGALKQAPRWMQDRGLEWLFRLKTEPRRLWQRYLLLNPWYLALVAAQCCGRHFPADVPDPAQHLLYG